MAYQLKAVTIQTDNSAEGMQKINELWADIASGKLPLLLSSAQKPQPEIFPIARYNNYESDEKAAFDLSILAVGQSFLQKLEAAVNSGQFKKYDERSDSLANSSLKAWTKVWAEQKSGLLQRAFSEDYELSFPAEYSADGMAHCALYIALR